MGCSSSVPVTPTSAATDSELPADRHASENKATHKPDQKPSQYVRHHGEFIFDGALSEDELDYAIKAYGVKGWLFLNPEDISIKSKVEAAGIKWECVPLQPPNFATDLASTLIKVLEDLPRPTMIQCSTARRATAAFALHATKDGGSPCELARTENFSCAGSKPLMDWLGETTL